MYHMKTVHVLQPIRNIGQLNESVKLTTTGYNTTTYKLDQIHSLIHLEVLVDIPVAHPLRDHGKLTISKVHSQ